MRVFVMIFLLLLSGFFAPAFAQDTGDTIQCSSDKYGAPVCITPAQFETDVCGAIETLATRHGVNPHFFARLIWQESRFNPNARSPANAQGIAQFIPTTAKIRGLENPWNPAEALDESARYMGRLVRGFGNEGLAAAAYNAGELRARSFMAGDTGLPNETWNYVQIITNISAKIWRDNPPENPDFRLSGDLPFLPACFNLAEKRVYTKYKALPQYKPWGVQLAAGNSQRAAAAAYRRRALSCKALLRPKSVDYIYKRMAGTRRVYTARIGFDDRRAAAAFCSKLKSSGCVCAVYRN
ncbi:transglycosylase [Amylibacter ulvae]|uniref:Transglycosylase n=1 Tax=Paramylibacter ulvae TaxID=1651968 RepID=A0ABQ3D348_9RHOB|nr:lytic transglycosylase domain-containing protein [Amylibacter ulvae]GHA55047.1 transglycosylase [Amylibacter ulvae]